MAWTMSVPGWKKIFIWAKPWMLRDSTWWMLEMEGEEPFHLGGVHAAVGLHDVDDGQVEVGEDVNAQAQHGQAAADEEPRQRHDHGDGVPHCENNRVHWPTLHQFYFKFSSNL